MHLRERWPLACILVINNVVPIAIVEGAIACAQDMLEIVVMSNSRSFTKDSKSGALAGFTRCTSTLRLWID